MKKGFLGKARPKGWRRRVSAVVKRHRLDRTLAPAPSGKGYLLAPCVVLLAAVFGTRAAYEWAMDSLEAARCADARRFWS